MQSQEPYPWERGDHYEQFMGRWSRQIAAKFLTWTGCTAGLHWLDVGCGTGALSGAVIGQCSPGLVVGLEPSLGYLRATRSHLGQPARLVQGTATQIPLRAASLDRVVSGLVMNFVSDPQAALNEMMRVTRRGGTLGIYVWDYAGKMEFLRFFWDTAAELDPDARRLDEGLLFPICQPEALRSLFAGAGLTEIEGSALEVETKFASFDDYWQPFLGGQGPAPAYVASLDAAAVTRLRDRLRAKIKFAPDGSFSFVARAWAIRGVVMG